MTRLCLTSLRRQIASARRLYLQDGKACERSLTGSDTLIVQAGFETLSVRYVRRNDAHKTGKNWAVRFSTRAAVLNRPQQLLRSDAARTMERLWSLCGTLLDRFSPNECVNYFHHCGYSLH